MSAKQDFLYIKTQQELNDYCLQAAKAPVLALDTEFVRTRTLYSKLGLIQVFDGVSVALIDPLGELDLEPFWSLLTEPNIVKVLHSCHEDLEVFKLYAKRLPTPLFDTQIAGQFLFQGKVLGFGAMVKQELGIELDKGEARTNWLKRPLTDKQLEYAYNDVKYLLPVYHKLNDQLIERNLDTYNLAEAQYKVDVKAEDKDRSLLFLDFGNAWQLKPRELAILQHLAEWRQDVAEKKDLALGFVVKDATLFSVAQRRPGDIQSLRNIPGVNPHEARLHGRAMIEVIAEGKAVDANECPAKVPRLTDYPTYKQALKSLKQRLVNVAEQSGIPIEMLATKKQMNQWIKWSWQLPYAQKSDFELSWRHDVVKGALLDWQQEYNLTTN